MSEGKKSERIKDKNANGVKEERARIKQKSEETRRRVQRAVGGKRIAKLALIETRPHSNGSFIPYQATPAPVNPCTFLLPRSLSLSPTVQLFPGIPFFRFLLFFGFSTRRKGDCSPRSVRITLSTR